MKLVMTVLERLQLHEVGHDSSRGFSYMKLVMTVLERLQHHEVGHDSSREASAP